MALTNAERQKRYRQRLKAAAARSIEADGGGDEVGRELLVGQYFAAGRELLARYLNEESASARLAAEAIDEFLEKADLTWLDLVDILQEAGQKAAVDIFERRYTEWRASLPPPPPPPAPPEPKKRRKRVT